MIYSCYFTFPFLLSRLILTVIVKKNCEFWHETVFHFRLDLEET